MPISKFCEDCHKEVLEKVWLKTPIGSNVKENEKKNR